GGHVPARPPSPVGRRPRPGAQGDRADGGAGREPRARAMTVAAIVLAGGASSRFGGDKLAAPLGDRPVLAHVVGVARLVAEQVVVVIGPDDPVPPLAGIEIARDTIAREGPLAGLVAGLRALDVADTALILAGDMPRVPEGGLV